MTKERQEAIALAHKVLERVNADPDDDIAVLARQLIRSNEEIDHLRAMAGAVSPGPSFQEIRETTPRVLKAFDGA